MRPLLLVLTAACATAQLVDPGTPEPGGELTPVLRNKVLSPRSNPLDPRSPDLIELMPIGLGAVFGGNSSLRKRDCPSGENICPDNYHCTPAGYGCCDNDNSYGCPYATSEGCCKDRQECAPKGYGCCPGSGFCPLGQDCCSDSCVTPGGKCCDNGGGCNSGFECCGDKCMNAGNTCCGSYNCLSGYKCCANTCMPNDATCCGDHYCYAGNECCGSQCMVAGATCCPGGNNACRPGSFCCGAICCRDGSQCCGGVCIVADAICCGNGDHACAAGQTCTATGCYTPPSAVRITSTASRKTVDIENDVEYSGEWSSQISCDPSNVGRTLTGNGNATIKLETDVAGIAVSQKFESGNTVQLMFNGVPVEWTMNTSQPYTGDTKLTGECFITNTFEITASQGDVQNSITWTVITPARKRQNSGFQLNKIALYGDVNKLRSDIKAGAVIVGPNGQYGDDNVISNADSTSSASSSGPTQIPTGGGGSGGMIAGPSAPSSSSGSGTGSNASAPKMASAVSIRPVRVYLAGFFSVAVVVAL